MTAKKEKSNMEIWEASERPPKEALKPIKGGRIIGMTDINPQWRIKKLTELFGVCGQGWWIEETRRDFVPCGDEIAVFIDVSLFVKGFDQPIKGTGGNLFRVSESRGLRCNDEAIKMAHTDALSVCCKHLGIASAIYEGRWDGSKYAEDAPNPQPQPKNQSKPKEGKFKFLDDCKRAKAFLGEEMYYEILGNNGYEKANQVEKQADMDSIMGEMALAAKAKKELEA